LDVFSWKFDFIFIIDFNLKLRFVAFDFNRDFTLKFFV